MKNLKKVQDYLYKNKKDLMKDDNILSIDVGYKNRDGVVSDIQIQFHVKGGMSKSKSNAIVPSFLKIEGKEYPTYVIENSSIKYEEGVPNYKMPDELE